MYSWSKSGIPCLALSRARLLRTQTAIYHCCCIAWMTLYNVYVKVSSLHEFVGHPVQNQPTRELISTQKTSHRHSKDLSRLRQLSPGMRVNTRYVTPPFLCTARVAVAVVSMVLSWIPGCSKNNKKIFLCLFLFIISIRDCLSMCHEHSFLFDVWSTLQTDNLPHHQI